MRALFQKRRALFTQRCLKYLRYVLNDHFVLVLLVFLGFILLQYRTLLTDFPENPIYVELFLLAVTGVFLGSGRVASYVEAADSVFLLAQEAAVRQELARATQRCFWVWGSLQTLGQLFLAPLYLALGFSLPLFLAYLAFLLGLKYGILYYQTRSFLREGQLQWETLLAYEERRKQAILQFFSLFTRVKGMTKSVKRRAYLDGLLLGLKKESSQTWEHLFLRSFLRSGDLFLLTVRLLVLSLLAMVFVSTSDLALGLVAGLDYLLVFQLLALYGAYDYQYTTTLYPLSPLQKTQGFERTVARILGGVMGGQVVVGLLAFAEKSYVLALPLLYLFFLRIYLPIKSKKLID